MKTLAVVVCLAAFVFLGWITLIHRVERWVVPAIEVTVTDKDGRALAVEKSDVSVKSDMIGDVPYEVRANGRIVIRPQKIWMRSSMGNPLFRTRITVDPEGFKACQEEVALTGGQVDGSILPLQFQIDFLLAEDGADDACEVR